MRLWTICVCQRQGLLPVHDSTHIGRVTLLPSLLNLSANSTPTGSQINFRQTAGYYKKAAWEAQPLWGAADLHSVVIAVASWLCPDGVVSLCRAVRLERRGTCLQKSIKINTCFKAAQSSTSQLNRWVMGGRYNIQLKTISLFWLLFLSQLFQMQPDYRKQTLKSLSFWWNPRAFWPSIDNNATTTFKVQKGSKDIVKIIHLPSGVQLLFLSAKKTKITT